MYLPEASLKNSQKLCNLLYWVVIRFCGESIGEEDKYIIWELGSSAFIWILFLYSEFYHI